MKTKILILANGQPPSKRLLLRLLKQSAVFVCADGGANTAVRLGLRPDLIIGDLDSIASETLRKFRSVQTRRIADQNSTDLEKALSWVTRKGYADIVVAGATGRRLDHSLGNLSALVKFSRKAKIRFVDDVSVLCFVGSECEFEAPPGTVVSLIPLSLCEGIVTRGLKWELKNESLRLGFRESTSNMVKSSPVSIRVRRGDLLLFIARKVQSFL
jgi:thiamine pyrophosphokinase